MAAPVLIKKYGNRRLYDTGESRYITLEELAEKVKRGADVRIIDAKSGEDLTQATLTQIVIESRGAARMLPVSLLTQLIRLGDDALAEFFGRYVTGALEVYLQARRGVQTVTSFNPLASLPFAATDALARMWMSSPLGGHSGPAGGYPPTGGGYPPYPNPYGNAYPPPPHGQPQAQPHSIDPRAVAPLADDDEFESDDGGDDDAAITDRGQANASELAALRREFEALKKTMRGDAPRRKKRPRRDS